MAKAAQLVARKYNDWRSISFVRNAQRVSHCVYVKNILLVTYREKLQEVQE